LLIKTTIATLLKSIDLSRLKITALDNNIKIIEKTIIQQLKDSNFYSQLSLENITMVALPFKLSYFGL
jgi:hypothetical protein